eukprot:TRINITY_DN78183_c0_g1_i1.p1 TRINITY_DN78183_c0_g1~~TRINITY_DN78183_c0_g1_i1.p1  ORF type:complete len:137 (-),score=46.24 TRINITY_DN78183_c0_g1_i1:80-490(-)
MQSFAFEMKVVASVEDAVKGVYSEVSELYVPELGAAFNEVDGQLNAVELSDAAARERYMFDSNKAHDSPYFVSEAYLGSESSQALRSYLEACRGLKKWQLLASNAVAAATQGESKFVLDSGRLESVESEGEVEGEM